MTHWETPSYGALLLGRCHLPRRGELRGVSAARSVAVAVMVCPAATFVAGEKVKEALPETSVVTFFWPMNFLPSSPEGLEKNWIRL